MIPLQTIKAIMRQRGLNYWEACSYVSKQGWKRRKAKKISEDERKEEEREKMKRWRMAMGEVED